MAREEEGKTLVKGAQSRDKNLELALQAITKQYGDGSIVRLGDDRAKLAIEVIPTGCLVLDQALGVGGFPRGRIVEIFGPESSGKTTLALTVLAQAQRMGGVGVLIDVEHALDPNYARRIGVNMNELLVSQPDSGEEALMIAETLIRSNAVDVVVVDSVAALVPRVELEGQIGDATVGAQARLMSSALRKLTSLISRAKTVCIFTNQLREKIGVLFGNPETTPGGRALKFYASVRIDIRKVAQLKAPDGNVIGNRTRVKIVKNKVAPPFTECEFDILYNEGISREGALVDWALEVGLLERKGSWVFFEGRQVGQGRDQAVAELKKNRELYEQLEARAKARLAEHEASSGPVTAPKIAGIKAEH
ncbi:recombinase RecA [Candidatus Methylacidithermus pantelleriae]|uniref:recombinase RecA n=1 Tax=Candidatus Methylacidithermus pantelleriae TaxID=2744239 RepID=UPI00157E0CC7|nr:recombinase RecA [Candidatus Methylacidithermus pantelleriae]